MRALFGRLARHIDNPVATNDRTKQKRMESRSVRSCIALALVACSHGRRAPELLAALPKPTPIDTNGFASVIVCDRCHTAGAAAMRDARGTDISPVTEAQASMMSLSARDPYYLAALRREIAANPVARPAIEATCNRCHAPVGFAESGGALSLDDLTTRTTPAAVLGREGAACAGCHALEPDGLGSEASFGANARLRTDRVSYGALPEPLVEAMVQMSNTTPVPSRHVTESRLCASCHTVLTHRLRDDGAPIGDEIPDQTTYLEWRNSAYQDETTPGPSAATCQACHMPRGEDELDKAPPIATAFSTRPPDAPVREGYRRHALRGGSSYLLRQLARNAQWLNAATTAPRLAASAAATDVFLTGAARLELAGTRGRLAVTVVNQTGHKLPTGFPARRIWLSIVATDASGAIRFVSGGHRDGALVGRSATRIDGPGVILPHRTTIDSPDQVAIWEAVPVDPAGRRTHLLLGTARIVKDDRILPAGWRANHADAERTRAIGVDGDPDFVAGRDTVVVRLPAAATRVSVELLYQSIPPETIESYRASDSREAARFRDVVAAPPVPSVLARAALEL